MGLEPHGIVWGEDPIRRQAGLPAGEEGEWVTEETHRLLGGRILLAAELVRRGERVGLAPGETLRAAESLVDAGRAVRLAAVEVAPDGAVCRRCGGREDVYVERCARCGAPSCPRCSRCAGMGAARGCEPLYAAALPLLPGETGDDDGPWRLDPSLISSLSAAQRKAMDQLREVVTSHVAGQAAGGRPLPGPVGCLVWAVAGAGKTEVAFGAAEAVLRMGGNVLVAVPRREVVVDIAGRAAKAFGGRPVDLLVGHPPGERSGGRLRAGRPEPGATQEGTVARLVVATTHQALRFYHAFALAIIDEVDAFPYAPSEMLRLAVERARHPRGLCVWMSATPDARTREQARRAGLGIIHIPARHHGHPLPVPELYVDRAMRRWLGAPGDRRMVPDAIIRWLAARQAGTRVLVFCPTVSLVEAAGRALGCPVVHSRHPQRERVLRWFSGATDAVLVTSTLLERGVTYEGVDVLVAWADLETVFDEATLVQAAGRSGRSARRPDGRVLFAAGTCTRAMRSAARSIEEMNCRARQGGFLL